MTGNLLEHRDTLAEIAALLALEADYIDRRCWREWVELFTPDSVFWVPAWRNEDEFTDDPEQELSLIYLPDRGIEDRIFRFSSDDSYASTPLATTSHVVGSLRVLFDDGKKIEVSAKGVVSSMDPRIGAQVRGVWYDYEIRRIDNSLKIRCKKVSLLERVIDGTIDVYNI